MKTTTDLIKEVNELIASLKPTNCEVTEDFISWEDRLAELEQAAMEVGSELELN